MLKRFLILLFSSSSLFQTVIYADESVDINEETIIEDVIPDDEVAEEPHAPQDTPDKTEPEVEEAQEEISEAQREADAAEAAELQEVGEGEEPVSE